MENSVAVTVSDAVAELAHEPLDDNFAESKPAELGAAALREGLAATAVGDGERLHILLEIEIEELEDEVELVAVNVDDVEQADNVGVAHFLEEADLSNRRGGDAFVLGLETYLLERDDAAPVGEIPRAVDDTVGA